MLMLVLIVYVEIHRDVCVDVEADANFDVDSLNLTKRKM